MMDVRFIMVDDISISLLKKILQKINIVSLVDIAYEQGLLKIILSKECFSLQNFL